MEGYKLNIVRSGAIMAIYVFVVIILYMVLSSPFEDIMGSYDNINSTASDSHIEHGSSISRTVFDMIFAGLVIVPLVWFAFMCFYREPDWRDRF